MKPAQLTVDEALRVVGHLLEHHPTTQAFARDVRGEALGPSDPRAVCYCLTGALTLVVDRFCIDGDLVPAAAALLIEPIAALAYSPGSRLAVFWDGLGDGWRLEAVEKLKRAGL